LNADWKQANWRGQSSATDNEKERAMETQNKYESGICYYQCRAKDFTPITVSADFAALVCPKCLNNNKDSFSEIDVTRKKPLKL
jgi:hypothetical protein